jgi:hypothetical protein
VRGPLIKEGCYTESLGIVASVRLRTCWTVS